MEREIQQKMVQLQDAQSSMYFVNDVRKERVIREELETLLHREEVMWAQKAKSDWIIIGEKDTKYFQTVVKQRRARSRILHIKMSDGTNTEDPVEIENILVNHFKSSYQDSTTVGFDSILASLSTLPIPQLSTQQCSLLNRPITNEEIKNTLFQLGPHKAPGPDGIPAFFFQEHWSIVKNDILNTVHAFFHLGYLSKTLNHTYITLVPKINFPDDVTHFRLISLCNVIYKVISKILVNRLKPFMDELITPFQNTFIRGRSITDNILLAHEILDMLEKKKGRKNGFGVLKIDMSKAYDRVN